MTSGLHEHQSSPYRRGNVTRTQILMLGDGDLFLSTSTSPPQPGYLNLDFSPPTGGIVLSFPLTQRPVHVGARQACDDNGMNALVNVT
jgi:hypothetical protein